MGGGREQRRRDRGSYEVDELQVPGDPLAVDRDEYLPGVEVGIELVSGVLGHREQRA